jgi:hypothetical protein
VGVCVCVTHTLEASGAQNWPETNCFGPRSALLFCERPEEVDAFKALARGIAMAGGVETGEFCDQTAGDEFPHFVVGKEARALAIECGAEQADSRRFVRALREWRRQGLVVRINCGALPPLASPVPAEAPPSFFPMNPPHQADEK